ncbi:uncharacterized protein LOC103696515 [Phoenix dactylifera]|uniref:Uncharacterized protein LOC103696515 n=1 Tax=Phoenix dactylifera TaxID=42345 RepID=A0A8B7BGP8_PHODC|nr:uncharacterized protein LOC103696515 [Phoenix dactylifera]
MAVSSSGRGELSEQWKKRETNPERTKVWAEPKPKTSGRKVSVVYYLARDGHLEPPHFMDVPLSSAEGLYLRDVINRLDILRGRGMAAMYSWSSKRSYKNGFVWHDLSEDDFIYPVHGQEYILKGSELPHLGNPSNSQEFLAASSSNSEKPPEIPNSVRGDSNFPVSRRKKTSCNSRDQKEFTACKSEAAPDPTVKFSDASTQTDDPRHRRRAPVGEERRETIPNVEATDIVTGEISPLTSPSSPETLEALIKAEGRIVAIRPEYREIPNCVRGDCNFPVSRRKKTSCNSRDQKEFTACKSEPAPDPAVKFSDASTQTDDPRHRRRAPVGEERRETIPNVEATDIVTDEISPPTSPSSPETLEALIKADGRIVAIRPEYRHRTVGACSNGRARASASGVLTHLIACGSISVKDPGISLVSQYRGRLPRAKTEKGTKEIEEASRGMPPSIWATGLEDME